MATVYSVDNDDLVASDAASGRTVWRGRPLGYPVWKALPIGGSDDAVVLLRYDAAAPTESFRNVLRVQPDGAVTWTAALPGTQGNAYTDLWVGPDAGTVVAPTWWGITAIIDLSTGRVVGTTLAK